MTRKTGLGLAVLLALTAGDASAQSWPTRQIEMIIPFPAGSGVDVIGRAVANAFAEDLKQNVIVLNREGAAGTLGFGALATAAPDGHTIGFGPTTPIANAPYLIKGVKYNVESFSYICQIFENVFTIALGPHGKYKSAKELFAAAKENPGKLTYGSAGLGTIPHLSMANLADALGLQFQHVPFRGDAPLVPALLKGETDFAVTAVSTIRGQPTIRPLATFAEERHPSYPEVPSVKELGVATGVPPGHNGMFAPKGLARDVQAALERACTTAITREVVRHAIVNTGQSLKMLSGAQFAAQTAADYKFKGELIKRLGLAGS
jgi:tripartite-type tricarboxylate transporter receptor subunit TctC